MCWQKLASQLGVLDACRAPEASHTHQQHLLHDRAPRRGQGTNPRRSTVPDHVRNPDKYTCYVLDEPLLVGGGDKGLGSNGGRVELAKVIQPIM